MVKSLMKRPWGLYIIIVMFIVNSVNFVIDLGHSFLGGGVFIIMGNGARVAYLIMGCCFLVCTYGLLKRQNWARLTAIVSMSIFGFVIYVFHQFLVRATANGYDNGLYANGKYFFWGVIGLCMFTAFYLSQKPVKKLFVNEHKVVK